MKKFTKLMSLFLAALMLLATLTGCAGSEDKKKHESNVPEVKFPLEEPYTLRVMVKGVVSQDELEKSSYYQKLVQDTNVKLEIIPLGDEPTTTLNAMLSAGTYGDVIIGVLNDSLLTDLAYGNFLIPIEDYIQDADLMPNYNTRGLPEIPEAINTMTLPNGHIYSVARIDANKAGNLESPLVVNKEWVKKSGADLSTIEGFTEYLRYVRDNDMNGDGNANDEVPLLIATSAASPYATVQACLGMWGLATKDSALDSYCVVKKGKVSLAPMMDAYKEAISTLSSWYKEGLIWSELYTANKESFNNRLNNLTAPQWGATFGVIHLSSAAPYADDLEAIKYPAIKGYQPCAYMNPGYLGYKNTFSVTTNCEHPEIALAWLDQIYSQDGTVGISYGLKSDNDIPGFTPQYDFKADGSIEQLTITPEQSEQNKKLCPSLASIFGGAFLYLRAQEDYDAGKIILSKALSKIGEIYKFYGDDVNQEVWPRPYYTQEVNDEINTVRTDVYNIITQYEAKWVVGQSDINKDWDSYKKQMEDAGAVRLAQLLQSAYDTWASGGKK